MWTGLGRSEDDFWKRSPAQIAFVLESVAEMKAMEAGQDPRARKGRGRGSGPGRRKGGPVEFAALVGSRKGVRARRRRKDRAQGDA